MTIAAGAVAMGRKQAEASMESTCVITRATAPTENSDGVLTPGTPTSIYSGVCRLRFTDARSNEVAAAGQAISKQDPSLSIPVAGTGAANVRPDDIATITVDTETVVARIAGMHTQTHATARRFPVEIQL